MGYAILSTRYNAASKDKRWNLFWEIGPSTTVNFYYASGRSAVALKKSLETFNMFISLLGDGQQS